MFESFPPSSDFRFIVYPSLFQEPDDKTALLHNDMSYAISGFIHPPFQRSAAKMYAKSSPDVERLFSAIAAEVNAMVTWFLHGDGTTVATNLTPEVVIDSDTGAWIYDFRYAKWLHDKGLCSDKDRDEIIGGSAKRVASDFVVRPFVVQDIKSINDNRPLSFWLRPNEHGTTNRLSLLAEILWEHHVKNECAIEREKLRKSTPAIALPCHATAATLLSPRNHVDDDDKSIYTADGQLVAWPSLPLKVNEHIMMADAFKAVVAQRLLRFIITEYHRKRLAGESGGIEIRGGIEGLRLAIGESSSRAHHTIRQILNAGHKFDARWGGNRICGLWTYRLLEQGKRSLLIIDPSSVLSSDYACQLTGHYKLLVPVLEMPPLHGNPQQHAQQALLQPILIERMVEKGGPVELAGNTLAICTGLSGLSEQAVWRTVEQWVDVGMLERVAPNAVYLADNDPWRGGRAVIDVGAEIRQRNSKRGLASVAKRKKERGG